MFLTLYKKEMRELAVEITAIISIVAVSALLFYLNYNTSNPRILAVPFILAAGLIGLVPLISSLRLISKEWTNNTIYLIMSLPVKGSMILGSKFLALITEYIAGTGAVLLAGSLLFIGLVPEAIQKIQIYSEIIPWEIGVYAYLSTIVILAYFLSISFFSQMMAKLIQKFRWLVAVVSFLTTWWLSDKLIGELGAGYVYMLNHIDQIEMGTLGVTTIAYMLAALLIFLLAVLIYNRKVEL
jgi:hypothetical protein